MRQEKLWVYSALPIIVLNLGILVAVVSYSALAALQLMLVARFSQELLSVAMNMLVCIDE
ncbi:MAG: hypothetical protein HZB51_33045 [Chloroflexi bacterium]|nr:hypothetical protein [Chloroflexota bacterium]